MRGNNVYLYCVYRNSDDRLMILDGTANECAKGMGIEPQSFYVLWTRHGGRNDRWTVTRKSRREIQQEMEE